MLVNTDAERSVIGSLLQSTECQHLLSELTPDDFTGDGDPFHHPHLSRYSERYALGLRW